VSVEQLGEPVEVAQTRTRGQLPRLLLSLLGIGVVIGLLVGLGSLFLGSFSQTEAGLCRLTWAPCAELSLASVEQLSGVDLPDGTEVVSGYAQELGTLHEFRAEVVLPAGAVADLSSAYEPQGSDGHWVRPVRDPDGHDTAVESTRPDGRTVIVFDERQVPAAT